MVNQDALKKMREYGGKTSQMAEKLAAEPNKTIERILCDMDRYILEEEFDTVALVVVAYANARNLAEYLEALPAEQIRDYDKQLDDLTKKLETSKNLESAKDIANTIAGKVG